MTMSTNWVAIKLLFYPILPFGWPPWLGWWGIIPSKAAKMGAITTDTTLSKLGSLKEVFDAIEPDTGGDVGQMFVLKQRHLARTTGGTREAIALESPLQVDPNRCGRKHRRAACRAQAKPAYLSDLGQIVQ